MCSGFADDVAGRNEWDSILILEEGDLCAIMAVLECSGLSNCTSSVSLISSATATHFLCRPHGRTLEQKL